MARRWARVAAAVAGLSLCGACAAQSEEVEASPDSLRSDPSATVSTDDPSVRLLSGYNAFLDRSTSTTCVVPTAEVAPQIGDVRGEFYLRHVKTREDLAKELDVDVNAAVKAPQASLDVATKVVKTFKQSSTTVTFLVRAARSYVVSNRSELAMTEGAREMLGAGHFDEFLSKCGGSFAKSVRYEAQVIGLLQFDGITEDAAQSIQASLGVSSPSIAKQVGSAKVDLKTKAEEAAAKYKASLSLTVTSSGFLSSSRTGDDVVERSFEKIDELRDEMNRSFDDDLARDRSAYASNTARNVRPATVGQGSYAQLVNAPRVNYTRLTATLTRAEEFTRDIAQVQSRLQSVYDDEIGRFLADTKSQFRYNIPQDPKLKTSDLVPIAEAWAAKLRPDRGTLVEPLRFAIDRCVAAAANGQYDACVTDEVLEKAKATGNAELAEYARSGRILPLATWMPRLDAKVSFRNAENECLSVSMRLPKRDEMKIIAPAVMALAGPAGEVWFASDAECQKPIYANGSGQGAFGCADNLTEPLPYVQDRPVLCVGRSGPATALPPP